MILDIYKDSIEFASRKISILLVLGVLSFFNFLIVPLIFVYGYNYKIIKLSTQSMINVDAVPPEFSGLKEMFIDGLKYIVVNLIYMIIPIIIIVFAILSKSQLLLVIGFLLALLCVAFSFLAIPHMAANNDSLKSAFALGELKEIMSFIGYGKYIAAYLGIVFISFAVIIIVSFIIGIIFNIFGIAASGVSTAGFGQLTVLINNAILLFLVSPFLLIFKNRSQGLIYNLRG
ncbi:DUF4013 domain-containing protein [uncultured Methanobrevibacter sp.]|uniref:DUF4013 domain-containing protein n=1 Tax=uncultured Methanobrevibacter sp. TaxID=253161 RepID=UPI0025DE9852|nr:DUF4013 domain-containing protein [uncultured Methanobrevibacter sp.]